jgi:hypothetical protein
MDVKVEAPRLRANAIGLVGLAVLGAVMMSPALGIYGNWGRWPRWWGCRRRWCSWQRW